MHVIQYSGGIGSWATAQRVAAKHGTNDMVLLFANTLVEEPTLYSFLEESAARLGVPLVYVADGRTPFEVYWDVHFLGNSRLAPCSRILKQVPARRWLTAHCDPASTTVYVGIDASETRRIPGIRRGWSPWTVEFPLTAEPALTKESMVAEARALGLTPPEAYAEGFAHANFFWTTERPGAAAACLVGVVNLRHARRSGATHRPDTAAPDGSASTSLTRVRLRTVNACRGAQRRYAARECVRDQAACQLGFQDMPAASTSAGTRQFRAAR